MTRPRPALSALQREALGLAKKTPLIWYEKAVRAGVYVSPSTLSSLARRGLLREVEPGYYRYVGDDDE